jgi:pimeloyl-ACP methyl ester carboxylesterase
MTRVSCPTLVAVGEHGVVGKELGELTARRLRHGEFVVLPGTSHLMHLQKPAAVLAALRPFIDVHAPAQD